MSDPSETDVKTDVRALKTAHRDFRMELKRISRSENSIMFTETKNDTAQCPRTTSQMNANIQACLSTETYIKEFLECQMQRPFHVKNTAVDIMLVSVPPIPQTSFKYW